MCDFKEVPGGVCAAKGFSAAGIHCGIRKNKERKDLALIYAECLCAAAAVYTRNKVKGAPITRTKENLRHNLAQAIVCNSGNANTCNANGLAVAGEMCRVTADALNIYENDIIVASTGVIGKEMDIEPIASHIDELAASLGNSEESCRAASSAIMTTDLMPKEFAVSFTLGGKTCYLGGIAKGSGMIHPNMATMLVFLTTDAAVAPKVLQKALSDDVVDTFNMISVDGDTSTNDMVAVMASGRAGNKELAKENDPEYQVFTKALRTVTRELCRKIAADGEGASKLLTCTVYNAADKDTARALAKSVITSSLVKSAMFGRDANWGRVLCAIGYAEADFDVEKIDVTLQSCAGRAAVCKSGIGVAFSEEKALEILSEKEIEILINMNDGSQEATAWGCDLTYDYVKINSDYRS